MAAFESTTTSHKVDDWATTPYGPNSALDQVGISRARSQDAVRNNPWLRKGLKLVVNHTIGCGIQPRPKIDDPVLRAELLNLWNEWVPDADADGALDFYGLQTLLTRARHESGEAFVRVRPRRPTDGLAVPLQLQIMEADLLPVGYNGLNGSNTVRQGIERNGIGKRVAYWFYREHPGDRIFPTNISNLSRVDAAEILHHYTPDRPGQLRGSPDTESGLLRARKLDQYESAELTRKRNRAKFQGAIWRESADENPLSSADPVVEDGRAMVDIEEGYMLQLGMNERAEFYGGDTGNSGIDFLRTHLRAIAAALGVPYELLTGDYEGTNDRIMRVILNVFYRDLEVAQDQLVHQVLRPVWNAWIAAVAYSGALALPDYFTDPRRYQRCEWRAHAWSYVNPLQEAQTSILRIANGLTSRSAAVAESGWDVEDIDAQQAADHAREESLDLHYGVTAQAAPDMTADPTATEKPTP
jgi:lambda family phage portal protein